ncbi:MAG TPA: tail fiber domain-containing protein [Cyclobacteriaceae bacterium]
MKTTNSLRTKIITTRILLLLIFSVTLSQRVLSQNIGINSTGATPASSAMLDIVASDKGLLIPRVALTATNAAGPVTSPATSLLVYNTATAGSAPNNVVPGYYYWNGTAWVALLTSSNTGWSLTGNSGTTPGTNFIGTTDDKDLVFKTNGTENMRIISGAGIELDAGTGSGTTAGDAISASGTYANYLEFNIQNLSSANLASSDIVATADNGTASTFYVDLGINSSGYFNGNSNILNGPNLAYLYANADDFKIGNGTPNKALVFFTNPSGGVLNTNTANGYERMRIDPAGYVGIGKNNPSHLLHLGSDDAAKPGTNTWTVASDRRLKKEIKPFTDGLDIISKVNPVWFKYNGKGGLPDDGKYYAGIIAQEIKEIAPYMIDTFTDKETNTEYFNYNGNAMTYLLVNAVKEQQGMIQEQHTTIDLLKKQLEDQNIRLKNLENQQIK